MDFPHQPDDTDLNSRTGRRGTFPGSLRSLSAAAWLSRVDPARGPASHSRPVQCGKGWTVRACHH